MAVAAPKWANTVAIPILSALLGAGGGGAGTYALVDWRLADLEDAVAEATSRQTSEDFGALKQRVTTLEADQAGESRQWRFIRDVNDRVVGIEAQMRQWEQRLNDDTFGDWTGWRHTVDAKMTGIEVDIRDLQRARP